MELKRAEDHGRWEGSTFVFDPPILVPTEGGDLATIRMIDVAHMVLPPDVTPDDVISALLNPAPPNSVFVDE